MTELRSFLEQDLEAIFDADIEAYHDATLPDLTIYERYVTPHRIDGLPFQDFMLTEAKREHSAGMAPDPSPDNGEPEPTIRARSDLRTTESSATGTLRSARTPC